MANIIVDRVNLSRKQDVRLESIFEETVYTGTNASPGSNPLTILSINASTNKTNIAPSSPNGPECSFRQLLKAIVVCEPAEDSEFEDKTASSCAASFCDLDIGRWLRVANTIWVSIEW